MSDLKKGVTIGYDGYFFGGYAFSAITDADPFGLFQNFWNLNLVTRNEPDATTIGTSVDFAWSVFCVPGIYFASVSVGFLWPSNRNAFNLGPPTQSPVGVDLFGGDLWIIPVEWNQPIGAGTV